VKVIKNQARSATGTINFAGRGAESRSHIHTRLVRVVQPEVSDDLPALLI